jgi:hypothetical protein
MFAYCKNNPANMSDEDGNRPSFIGETAGDVELSVAKTQQMLTVRSEPAKPVIKASGSSAKKKSSSSVLPSKSQITDIAKSAVTTGIEGGISSTLKDIPDFVPLAANRAMRRAGQEFMIPVEGASVLRGIGQIERVGVVGVAFTGVAVWDDFHSGYSSNEAWGRAGIDAGVSAAVIGIGLVTPIGWAIGIGVVAGVLADTAENYLWRKQ